VAEIAGLAAQLGMVVVQGVARYQPTGAGIDANHPLVAQGIVAGILERLPGDLEKQPLLGVHKPGLARRITEKRRVEPVEIRKDRRGPDIMRIGDESRIDASGQQFFFGKTRYRLDAADQIVPEYICVSSAGKPAGDTDDRDIAIASSRHYAASMKSR